MQAKRIGATTSSGGVGAQHSETISIPLEPREEVNWHNYHASVGIEPESAGANANGFWALMCIEDPAVAIPSISSANLSAENFNSYIIATGAWVSSNESGLNFNIDLKTSRNCRAGTRVILAVRREGISAGNVRIVTTSFFHTVRK